MWDVVKQYIYIHIYNWSTKGRRENGSEAISETVKDENFSNIIKTSTYRFKNVSKYQAG